MSYAKVGNAVERAVWFMRWPLAVVYFAVLIDALAREIAK